ncbi:MAG: hypothetical protein QX198_18075 [Methylococcaceae bacterium]
MRNKAILFSLMLVASSSALAEQSLLEDVAKQAVTDKVSEVAPGAIEKVNEAKSTLNQAKSLKDAAEISPETLQEQAKEAVKQKVTAAVPEEAKKAGETLKTGKESAENLKEKIKEAPKATKTLKSKAKEKAAEKALKLIH